MDALKQALCGLGSHSLEIIIFIIEIVAAVALFHVWQRLYNENRRQKAALQYRNQYYDKLFEGMNQVHLLIRRKDCYPEFVSENLREIFGLTYEDMVSDLERLGKIMPKETWKKFFGDYQAYCDCAEKTAVERDEGTLPPAALAAVFPYGTKRYKLTVTPWPDGKYDLFAIADVTEEYERIGEMEVALAEAANESKTKTTFLSRMSHEIRTPMNGIIGMLSLAQTHLREDTHIVQYLEKAADLSEYLLSLINDILDMSRIEANKIELESLPFDLYELGESFRNMFQKNLETKGLHFDVLYQDIDERYVMGDRLRLSQVIVNFLSNAQKFTSQGEVIVTIRQMMKNEDTVNLMLRVHDTGIGIEPDFLNHIFKPFEQESIGITKTYGGSGLGMAISDQIVRLMGGQIVVDSAPGKGSDFTIFINLPIAKDYVPEQPAGETAENGTDFRFEGRRILMAEDNEINEEIAVEILSDMGAETEVAHNGQEAVEMFSAHPEGYYDFILMDVQMPVMNGRDAARAIRSLDRPDSGEILIFALSADAFVEDERLSKKAGMNGHFSKPIDFDALEKGIGAYIREREHNVG